MNFFGHIGLIVLTLVGYSIGRVLFVKKYQVGAELVDGIIIGMLWIGALVMPLPIKWPPHLVWPGIAAAIGFFVTLVLRSTLKLARVPSEPEEPPSNFLKQVWNSWKTFAFRLGNFQGRLIMLVFYFTILMPFGIINSVFRDPLYQKRSNRTSYWFDLHDEEKDIQDARRQF